MIWQSRFSIGIASSRSSPLPCGTPSTTSISTTSASSFEAIQCAAVAPTFPAPTIVTFFRITLLHLQLSDRLRRSRLCRDGQPHVFDHSRCELTRLRLGRALHLPLKIVSHKLLLNGLLQRAL